MKTIEVSDEMHAKLVELATEMTTQNMRSTAMPHMFQIKTIEQFPVPEGYGGNAIWIDSEGQESSEEELEEVIIDYGVSYLCFDEENLEEERKTITDDDKLDILEKLGYREINVVERPIYKNTFFTAKACQEHINKNNYHYKEPSVYLHHAWRNPEMELVSEFLCGLVGKKQHK